MVAATIRKIQAKNQLAAVFEVSGSPLENLVAGSKYEVMRLVASLIPARPWPCAKVFAAMSAHITEKRILLFIVESFG